MHTQTCISTWLVHPQTNPHLCFQHSWTMMACPGTTSPLHSLKSSPSLCLGYTLTHTQTHLATLKNILTYTLFSSWFFSLQSFVSIPPPTLSFPLPLSAAMFPSSHLSNWVTACENKNRGTSTITWGASLGHTLSLSDQALQKNTSPCRFVYRPFTPPTPPPQQTPKS